MFLFANHNNLYGKIQEETGKHAVIFFGYPPAFFVIIRHGEGSGAAETLVESDYAAS